MSTEIIVALITTLGGLLGAIVVEAIRRGKAQRATDERLDAAVGQLDAVMGQLSPNGGKSVADAVTRIEGTVERVQETQAEQGQRIAAVEARVSDHIAVHGRG